MPSPETLYLFAIACRRLAHASGVIYLGLGAAAALSHSETKA